MNHEKFIISSVQTFRPLTPALAQEAVHGTLMEDFSVIDNRHFGVFRDMVRWEEASQLKPSWLNLDIYVEEFIKLDSTDAWESIFTKLDQQHVDNLADALEVPRDDVAKNFAELSIGLYGASIPLFALSAVYGTDIRHILTLAGELSPLAEAVQAAGRSFDTPASSLDDVNQRLLMLFPEQEAHKQPGSAYTFLEDNLAFSCYSNPERTFTTRRLPPSPHSHQERPEVTINPLKQLGRAELQYFRGDRAKQYKPENAVLLVCYGQTTVRTIFEALGSELRNPEYKHVFDTRVTTSE